MPFKKPRLTLKLAAVLSVLIWIATIAAALATRKYLM